MELFITCIPGLEPALQQELQALGITYEVGPPGGLRVKEASLDTIYTCNYMLRSASRVLLQLAVFPCVSKEDLYNAALGLPWEEYFKKMPTFCIDAAVTSEAFNNSLFAAQLFKDAVCDRLRKYMGRRPDIDTRNPGIRLNLFMHGNKAIISFDTSNDPLHERGYRGKNVRAPIRENLAAGILLLAGYTKNDVLVDPCAGSGTFLLEAAMIATNTPPAALRGRFGFQYLPFHKETEWHKIQSFFLKKRVPLKAGSIIGIERDPATFDQLQANCETAGFAKEITLQRSDFRTAEFPVLPTFVITNPPYGKRLSEERSLEGLYQALGDFMKQKAAKPGKGAIFTGNLPLAKCVGLKTARRFVMSNGGIDCRLLVYDLY